MSFTRTVGKYPIDYWTFMARSMSIRLKIIIKNRRIEADSIPPGVLHDARKYFDMLVDDGLIRSSTRSNMSASDPLSSDQVPGQKDGANARGVLQKIQDHKKFVDQLEVPRELSAEDVKEARRLVKFFNELAEDGEAERYYQAVKLNIPGIPAIGVTMRNGRLVHG